jgi:hypothetical protein
MGKMILIKKSPTADTRTCDYANVSKVTLVRSTYHHIDDVQKALDYFRELIFSSLCNHDKDKLSAIDQFYSDFLTGFKEHSWWDNHRKISRHHLIQDDGVPTDVNLIDVLEFIADCVMAGMARSGNVYPLLIKPEVLIAAFNNTVELLKANVRVKEDK